MFEPPDLLARCAKKLPDRMAGGFIEALDDELCLVEMRERKPQLAEAGSDLSMHDRSVGYALHDPDGFRPASDR